MDRRMPACEHPECGAYGGSSLGDGLSCAVRAPSNLSNTANRFYPRNHGNVVMVVVRRCRRAWPAPGRTREERSVVLTTRGTRNDWALKIVPEAISGMLRSTT